MVRTELAGKNKVIATAKDLAGVLNVVWQTSVLLAKIHEYLNLFQTDRFLSLFLPINPIFPGQQYNSMPFSTKSSMNFISDTKESGNRLN